MNTTLEELRESISTHLDLCEAKNTPFVCANCSTPDGKSKMIDSIVEIIIKQDNMTVGGAILELERLYNVNMLD